MPIKPKRFTSAAAKSIVFNDLTVTLHTEVREFQQRRRIDSKKHAPRT